MVVLPSNPLLHPSLRAAGRNGTERVPLLSCTQRCASANEENPFSLDSYDHLLGRLESGTEDFSSAEINDLSTLAAQLMTMKVADGLDPESDEAGAAQKRVQKLEILGNAIRDLALDEK